MNAVLFDYDDTLVQTRQCKYRALQALASRHYGVELTSATIDQHWGIAYRELFRALFAAHEPDLDRAILRYEELDAEFKMTAYPETLRTLEALSQRALLGIVTAAGGSLVRRQMAELGLRSEWLVVLQTAEDSPHHKPDPRVFEPALAELRRRGVERASVTYIGDALHDFYAARDAGLGFWGVLHGTTSREAFTSAGARTLESLRELLERL